MVAHDSWANVVNATVVYAKCKQSERRALWSELGTIASTITRPWLVCWDFNIISSVTEYVGRATQDLGAIADFNEAISSCCLTEVPFSGSLYAWSRVRDGARVWKRLDRALVNQQ